MATHSSILAWRITWREEPGGLQSMGSQRVRHDLATDTNEGGALIGLFFIPCENVTRVQFCLAFASTSTVLVLHFSISEVDLQNIGEKKKTRETGLLTSLTLDPTPTGDFFFSRGFYCAKASAKGDPGT